MVPPRGHPLRKTGHPLPWHGHPGNNIPPPMIEFTRHDLVHLTFYGRAGHVNAPVCETALKIPTTLRDGIEVRLQRSLTPAHAEEPAKRTSRSNLSCPRWSGVRCPPRPTAENHRRPPIPAHFPSGD